MKHTCFIALVCLVVAGGRLDAVPRFMLLTGTRCSGCHFNPQGGGARTLLGWSFMNHTGAIKFGKSESSAHDSTSIDDIFNEGSSEEAPPAQDVPTEIESNAYWDGLLTLGFDMRLQMAKLGRPTAEKPDVPRRFIPMQLSPYVTFQPSPELTVTGSFNVAGIIYKAMSKDNSTFNGQTDFDAAAQYQPDITLPTLKVGYIQPSIGIRHDDHTMFIRRDLAQPVTIIPPYYNEVGGEIIYEGQPWLTLNAGVYGAQNLSKVDASIDKKKPSVLGRAVFWPQWLDEGINTMIGASYLVNGDFQMINGFVGIGQAEKATIYGEGMYTQNATGKTVRNFSIMGSYSLTLWLALEWRYEHGLTEDPLLGADYANAFTLGAEFFVLPYVELRPEYRFLETDNFELGQFTAQLHVFY